MINAHFLAKEIGSVRGSVSEAIDGNGGEEGYGFCSMGLL